MKDNFCPYCMSAVEDGVPCPTCGLTAGAYTPSPHHLPPGTILMDRYMVGRVLGEGGFGITYIGCDLRLELKVAIKEYFPTDKVTRHAMASLDVTEYVGLAASSYEEGKRRFLLEARTMARMEKQPQIVSVRDFFEAHGTAYIVMEYVEGTTFKELVKQRGGRIAPRELLPMIEPLFSALTAMHELGLIHRDISPDNLMLEKGAVRLLDFGCARESSRGTETMTIALKHGYAPVEQYQHKGQGPWTDVYGLSATIYFCLTGQVPPQALDRLCDDELILPRKLGIDLTEYQEQALLYGMGIRPRRRFQSVSELHAALYGTAPVNIPRTVKESLLQDEPIFAPPAPQPVPKPVVEPEPIGKQEPEIPQKTYLEDSRPTPEVPSEEAPAAPARRRRRPKGNPRLKPAIIGAAVVAVIALIALLWPKQPAENLPGENTDPNAQVQTDPTNSQGEIIDLFEDAVHMTVGGEEKFRKLLADDNVSAIILETRFSALTNGPLEINKPVLIPEGSGLNSYEPITIGSGGLLQLVGSELCIDGLLQLTTGGTLKLESGAWVSGSGTVIMEHSSQLMIGTTCSIDINGFEGKQNNPCVIVLNEGALFANATHVKSFAELRNAVIHGGTEAIVIDSDIEITEKLTVNKPLLISEGVTLSRADQLKDGAEWGIALDAALIVNRGTCLTNIVIGDWTGRVDRGNYGNIINYGTMEGRMHLDCQGTIINYGTLRPLETQGIQTSIVNLGEITVDNSSLDLAGIRVTNHGLFQLLGEFGRSSIANNGFFVNSGSLVMREGANFCAERWLLSAGSIRAEDGGILDGSGVIEMVDATAELTVDSASEVWFIGALVHHYDSNIDIAVEHHFDQIPFAWDGGDNQNKVTWFAHTERELLDALADDSCRLVKVEADITVNQNLTITKGVAASHSITLKDGCNLTVSGEDAFVYSSRTDVGNGTVRVENGAVWLNMNTLSCGTLEVAEGAAFYNNADVTGLTRMDIAGNTVNIGHLEATDAKINISTYRLVNLANMHLHHCQIEIARNAELCSHTGHFSLNDCTVTNRGSINFNFWEWQQHELNNTQITNYGSMNASERMTLGNLTNHGQVHLWGETTLANIVNHGTIEVDGLMRCIDTVDNRGTITLHGGFLLEGGTIVGNQPKVMSN